jgi:YebC/PmpR family DNA-binding regulatory protein
MYRKGAQDAKRAKMFAKLAREITVAAKLGGSDANSNPRLRSALSSARASNMPKDNVDRAIAKAAGGDSGANYEEVRYEGYGPGGVAVIVESLTDNRCRTASEVRSAFSKFGCSLGESGSVSFSFVREGMLLYAASQISFDDAFNFALEVGADDVERIEEDLIEVTSTVENFGAVRDGFVKKFGDPMESGLVWKPNVQADCSEESAVTFWKLIDILDDNDDVQRVFHNMSRDRQ